MTTYKEIELWKEQIINDYNNVNIPTHEICKKYGISFKLLDKCLNLWGVERRGRGGGRKPGQKYSDKELIEGLKTFAKKLGKTPTYQEMEDFGPFSGWTYKVRFGSWNNAINLAHLEEGIRGKREGGKGQKHVSDEELLEHLRKLYKKYKRIPTDSILRKEKGHTSKVYRKRFGSLAVARKKAGIKEEPTWKRISDQELLNEIKELLSKLQRVPTTFDMSKYGKYSIWCYIDRFGSWAKALNKAGIEPLKENKNFLLNEIKRLNTLLGHPPTMKDMEIFGKYHPTTYYNYFSSWTEVLSSAGLLPTKYHIIAKDGHICRSNGEVMIDNFLFSHNIQHEREPLYPNSLMKADWLIKNCIYVEYFGLINFPWYKNRVKQKLEIINKNNIPFIGIFPEDLKNLEDKFACVLK